MIQYAADSQLKILWKHTGHKQSESPTPRAKHKATVSMSSPPWSPRHTDTDIATAAHQSKQCSEESGCEASSWLDESADTFSSIRPNPVYKRGWGKGRGRRKKAEGSCCSGSKWPWLFTGHSRAEKDITTNLATAMSSVSYQYLCKQEPPSCSSISQTTETFVRVASGNHLQFISNLFCFPPPYQEWRQTPAMLCEQSPERSIQLGEQLSPTSWTAHITGYRLQVRAKMSF